VGRNLRVPGVTAAEVDAALQARAVEARLDVVPATFEEAFVNLAQRNAA